MNSVKNILWDELKDNKVLPEEDYDNLVRYATTDKNGKYKKFTVDNFIKNEELIEEFIPIFEALGFEYDAENNKYYTTKEKQITYALPLIPEGYFRKKNIEIIALEDLTHFVSNIEKELKDLFGGGNNEN